MAKRRSDVAVIQSMPVRGGDESSTSVTVRKIDNGYVVSTSQYGDGKYSCTERYSAMKPDVAIGAGGEGRGPNSLKDAIKSLG